MRRRVALAGLALAAAGPLAAQQGSGAADPRIGLKAGWMDAGQASWNMRLLASRPRPEGLYNPANPGDIFTANTDVAFRGHHLFLGNFSGWQVFDIADPTRPWPIAKLVCPGGQGDVSIHGDLLFMSVEMTNGRVDCGTQGAPGQVNAERFRGVRIFDISDLSTPRQVAAVQTCRGSHTHTLVPDPRDEGVLYVYVSGTSVVRANEELAGCSGGTPDEDPNTALFRIEVIRVPLAAPQDARVVSAPRIFADRATGRMAGLWPGGAHGEGTQRTSQTNQCHDITVYPALGLAAGACSGNGILLDVSDPVNPVRIDEVIDPNFAYWHSATFSNDGRTVVFTDEWGGGTAPRCRATDRPEWGANAIFRLQDRKLTFAGYYKLPVPQTALENCVAHNGALVPVPGRDIKVQAWYQGGISVMDFTDPAKPFEIAFFDRGSMSDSTLHLGGFWSAYWYNGYVYGAEIGRGLDVLELLPGDQLTANELEAARLVQWDAFNPQTQPRIEWPANVAVARALMDQLARGDAVPAARLATMRRDFDRADAMAPGAARRRAFDGLARGARELAGRAGGRDAERLTMLAGTAEALGAM